VAIEAVLFGAAGAAVPGALLRIVLAQVPKG
jgi:hypothetical protein